jgi:hypothetical protein
MEEEIVINPGNQENYDATVAAIQEGKITWREVTREKIPEKILRDYRNAESLLLIEPSEGNQWSNQFTSGLNPEFIEKKPDNPNKKYASGIIHEALFRQNVKDKKAVIQAIHFTDPNDNGKDTSMAVLRPEPEILMAHLENIKEGR